jgi:threonyl-tRNA synthetase
MQVDSKQKRDKLLAMRHSAEHVLTQAMLKLYPGIKMAMGPATDNGFYFDFDYKEKVSEDDFPKIEAEMKRIIKKNLPFKKEVISISQARKLFKGNQYKQEWLDEIQEKGQKATVYWTGDQFVDLCAGPHVKSTGEIGAFKLLQVAGAYWRGDEKNKMLTRIYGTSFPTQKELDYHLNRFEEIKKIDHRILGRELDIFIINNDIGKGLPLLTPKGTIIRNQILEYERQLEKEYGFQEVWTPHIAKNDLYKKTGHWQHYRETMYEPFGIEDETYVLKPMNCPHHYMIYASQPRSYKDLPIRFSEPGTCYRFEKSGELGGLSRVRALTIDDSHILMREDQIEDEYKTCITMVKKMFKAFSLSDYYVRLSLSDPADHIKYIADPKAWKRAGNKLEKIIKDNRLDYKKEVGEASFYGPKIDFMVKDFMGREWQMSTLQLDLFMANKLDLTYVDRNGSKQHPAILHRGLTGSLERTIGILIEHFAGAFPLWLSPVQVVVIPISDKYHSFSEKVGSLLKEKNIRVEVDDRSLSMQKRIRDAELQKVPYMAIVGEKEKTKNAVSLRARGEKDLGSMPIKNFLDKLLSEIKKKSSD